MKLPLDLECTIAFLARCRVPYALGTEVIDTLQYRGDGVLRANLDSDAPAQLCHELAHFVLCPLQYLRVPEYGLGASPEGGMGHEANDASTRTEGERSEEETRASMLGILIERTLRLRSWPRTYRLHGWDGRGMLANRQHALHALNTDGLVERYRSHSSAHPLDCWRARLDEVEQRAQALRPLFADPISAPEPADRSARVPARTSDSGLSHPQLG